MGMMRSALTSSTSSSGQEEQQAARPVQVGSRTWGNLPVNDLGGNANGFGRSVSDSEVDGDSEAELNCGSESTDDDSDEDLDQALAGPTKTLFVSAAPILCISEGLIFSFNRMSMMTFIITV